MKLSYYLITALVPVVFFLLFEGVLRLLGYGQDQPVAFISDPIDSQYQIMNPQVSTRYFSDAAFAPVGAYDLFRKEKTDSTFRIFVQGASSSAGFPFRSASFPRLLEQKLQAYYPQLDVEVVNTSLVATNSYAILDLTDEIIEKQPDLVIIYGGHNEYYGALGVGSSQSLGRSPVVTNFYLRLKNVRIMQLVRNMVKGIYATGATSDRSETLMSKMVREESIPLNSKLYEAGLNQYEYNIAKTLEKYKENQVPVFLSTLVSNLKDFEPFESSVQDSAMFFFNRGKEFLNKGQAKPAKEAFTQARDRDLLKFRATSGFQQIVRKLSNEHDARLLDMYDAFEKASPNEIIGNELLVEHVHANLNGQRLFAETAFHEVVNYLDSQGIEPSAPESFEFAIAELDSMYGYQLANQLMQNWPFTEKAVDPQAEPTFLDRLTSGEISWVGIMNENFYENIGKNPKQALSTARVLLQEFPNQLQPYLFVSQAYTALGRFDDADRILNSVPDRLITREVLENKVNNSLRAKRYSAALSYVSDLLKGQSDIHYNKVKESLEVITNQHSLPFNRRNVLANADQFIQKLEALIFLQNLDEAKELNDNLLKLIPQNDALKRINQRGVF
ncbi:hypothetical protein [Roseivirga sp.]|uniref:hypothetical protein n=1 Tax=Roseivirga sp. TaxID=1964215 RepID=UPI003B52A9DC